MPSDFRRWGLEPLEIKIVFEVGKDFIRHIPHILYHNGFNVDHEMHRENIVVLTEARGSVDQQRFFDSAVYFPAHTVYINPPPQKG